MKPRAWLVLIGMAGATAVLATAALANPALANPALADSPPAPPSDPIADFNGEKVTWELRYAGANVGTAWSQITAGDDGSLSLEGGAANAPWYGKIYTLDDWVRSTWHPDDGSQRYETHFREGGFHQDQDMVLDDDAFVVSRRQYIDKEWREWTRTYDGQTHVEDPLSAVHRIRQLTDADAVQTALGTGWTFPVFSGEKTWPLIIVEIERDTIKIDALGGEVAVRVLELRTEHKGLLEQRGKFRIWVTDDARRIPVRMVVKTNFGGVRAELSEYQPPTSDS